VILRGSRFLRQRNAFAIAVLATILLTARYAAGQG
jgi:hypothetical protein